MTSLCAELQTAVPFLAKRQVLSVVPLSDAFSSRRRKYKVATAEGTFFVKDVEPHVVPCLAVLHVPDGTDRVLAPAPVAIAGSYVVSPWIDGQRLLPRIVIDVGLRRYRLLPALSALGQWLRAFHTGQGGQTPEQPLKPEVAAVLRLLTPEPAAGAARVVRCHNDLTLRNLALTGEDRLVVFDLDAACHPAFPAWAWPEHDLSLLAISLLSLIRIPGIGPVQVRPCLRAVLRGYFGTTGDYSRMRLQHMMRLHYFGWLLDRPLPAMYRGRRGPAFMARLARLLADGGDWLPNEAEVAALPCS